MNTRGQGKHRRTSRATPGLELGQQQTAPPTGAQEGLPREGAGAALQLEPEYLKNQVVRADGTVCTNARVVKHGGCPQDYCLLILHAHTLLENLPDSPSGSGSP